MKAIICSVENPKKIRPGNIVLFEESYLSGLAVVVDRDRWLKMAGVEYPKCMLEEIKMGKKGIAAVVIGELMGSFMHGDMDPDLPQSEIQRRFVFIETERFKGNSVFLCRDLGVLKSMFKLRLFSKYGGDYFKTIPYDLLVLNGFKKRQKCDDFGGPRSYGGKLFNIFRKCIPR